MDPSLRWIDIINLHCLKTQGLSDLELRGLGDFKLSLLSAIIAIE